MTDTQGERYHVIPESALAVLSDIRDSLAIIAEAATVLTKARLLAVQTQDETCRNCGRGRRMSSSLYCVECYEMFHREPTPT